METLSINYWGNFLNTSGKILKIISFVVLTSNTVLWNSDCGWSWYNYMTMYEKIAQQNGLKEKLKKLHSWKLITIAWITFDSLISTDIPNINNLNKQQLKSLKKSVDLLHTLYKSFIETAKLEKNIDEKKARKEVKECYEKVIWRTWPLMTWNTYNKIISEIEEKLKKFK